MIITALTKPLVNSSVSLTPDTKHRCRSFNILGGEGEGGSVFHDPLNMNFFSPEKIPFSSIFEQKGIPHSAAYWDRQTNIDILWCRVTDTSYRHLTNDQGFIRREGEGVGGGGGGKDTCTRREHQSCHVTTVCIT